MKGLGGDHPFEEFAQFTVARVGPVLLATVPFEPTTTVGSRMREAIRRAMPSAADAPASIAIVGLANGYLQYVTTAEEYRYQFYEGGSTIYRPRSAEVFGNRLAVLTRGLATADWHSPAMRVPTVETFPAKDTTSLMPTPPKVRRPVRRAIVRLRCENHAAVMRWVDEAPGALFPAHQQVLALQHRNGSRWRDVAWDDHHTVEVRAIRGKGRAYLWEVRVDPIPQEGTLRFVLLARAEPGPGRLESEPFQYRAKTACGR